MIAADKILPKSRVFMHRYINKNPDSPLAEMESRPDGQGNETFFHLRGDADAGRVKARLQGLGQRYTGECRVENGTVLITRGADAPESLVQRLAGQGKDFAKPETRKPFNAWKWRGRLSDAGQVLVLASSVKDYVKSGKPIAEDKLAFAALGLSANYVNKVYGAQKEDDPHRMAFLKAQIDRTLAPSLPPGAAAARSDEKPGNSAATPGETFNRFAARHSVRGGEIGLRYLGSLAMIAPLRQLKTIGMPDHGGAPGGFKLSRAWDAVKRDPSALLNKDKTNLWTGIIYTAGRTLGLLFAKTPDPFDPKPKSALDRFRENVAFRLSSVIEVAAASTLAIGSFRKKDAIGGVGAALLATGLATRYFAPFGTRQVDKDALYDYAESRLALAPAEKQPALLAETAGLLSDHLKDAGETFGDVYAALDERLRGRQEASPSVQANPASIPEARQNFSQKLRKPAASFSTLVAEEPRSTLSMG